MKIFFLGWSAKYERHFIKYLSENYDVEHIISPKWLRRHDRITTRILGHSYRPDLFAGIYCWMRKFRKSDLLICNDNTINSRINPEIIKKFPGKKIMLIRNLVDSPFLEKWGADFDATYSFDPEQCEKLGMGYMHQFMPMGYKQPIESITLKKEKTGTTAFFVGLEKGRAEVLLDLASMLDNCGCKIDFRIVVDKSTQNRTPYHITSQIDYYELQEATLQADVLIDIGQPGQSGFTLRTLEAAYYGKKLITNNQKIIESPLYNPNNIMVLGSKETWNTDTFLRFLNAPLQPVAQEIIYKHSPDFMLEFLMKSHDATS